MTGVLCWPVAEAVAQLTGEGLQVQLVQTRYKRDGGTVARVVRQQQQGGICCLTWALFHT